MGWCRNGELSVAMMLGAKNGDVAEHDLNNNYSTALRENAALLTQKCFRHS